MEIENLKLREIFATNSQKTIEVELKTPKAGARASVPIGTSRSKYEIRYLPTNEIIEKFQKIKSHLIKHEFSDQADFDSTLRIIDKTWNFREIGGNLALALSSAFCKVEALKEGKELFKHFSEPKIPLPICNVIGGWRGQSDIQEYLILSSGQKLFFDSIEKISSVYLDVAKKFKVEDPQFKFSRNLESAWVTSLKIEKIIEILTESIKEKELALGLDVAASQLWDGKKYVYSDGKLLTTQQLSLMEGLANDYPILFFEDPFHEDDFTSFSALTQRLKGKIICGDDLFASNLNRLKIGINYKATNAILIKPNQVGTISDVIKLVEEAKKNNLKTVMSHRSGETEDTLICHLATGLSCDYIKLGTTAGERTVKINEMIRIEEKLAQE
jgi:enolase